ncbi:Cytochrome c [Polystyrenella longa]|uniref:Cytochrome c n=1 Tax=Polystyrenella longa TaxID=2528007 RepID=A0A518CJV0_9PLAN|nr:PVC-type heme-binding CxxCH protein [Polystyrenella longa]QDU79490.1 Cytochrome c [Polystyrenella longa]
MFSQFFTYSKFTLVGGFFLSSFAWSNTLTAEERLPEIEVLQSGVKLTVAAEHPEVATPTGIDVDEAGNIWVVASHTHFPPVEYKGPKFDEILVLSPEGTRSVFYNQTHHTMDLELGKDNWVYLIERSRLLRIRDTDQDGVADESEDLVTLETKAVYPHNGMAGLAWDLNGELMFCLGENFSEAWSMTGTDGTRIKGSSEGGVFRLQPDGSGLKRVARGMWNPFGLCVRENGEIFAVDNDPGELPPCRLLQIEEGGDYGYQRQYGAESHHPFVCWNGELRGTLPMVHPVGEAPCGIAAFGRGLLAPSWGEHHIAFYPLQAQGAGYKTSPIQLVKGSRYFRPACIAVNKAESRSNWRSWYVTDWVDGRYNVHGYGRIWKLEINLEEADWLGSLKLEPETEAAKQAERLRTANEEFSVATLVKTTTDPDPYLAQAAYVGLSKRVTELKWNDVESADHQTQLAVLVALRMASLRDDSTVNRAEWVPHYLEQTDPEVQFELLRWIADVELKEDLPAVEKLYRQSGLRFEVFEAAIATINTLQGQPEIGLRNEELLLERVNDNAASPELRAFALRLLPATLEQTTPAVQEGETAKQPQKLNLSVLQNLLEVDDDELSLEVISALGSNLQQGEEILLALIQDDKAKPGLRAAAIVAISPLVTKHRQLFFTLMMNADQSVREEALRGLRGAPVEDTERVALKKAAASFPESADLVAMVLNPLQVLKDRPADSQIEVWSERLDNVPGDPDIAAGRRLFHHPQLATCGSCHRHKGKGNTVGPDLSTVHDGQKKGWLLESILQPSRDMSPEYRPTLLLLEDGRTFTGIRLQAYTKEAIRDRNGEKRVFDRDEVEMIKDLDVSFMPQGIAQNLTDRELRDLIAFLNQL